MSERAFFRRVLRRMFSLPGGRNGGLRVVVSVFVFLLLTRAVNANMIDDFTDSLKISTGGWLDRAMTVARFLFIVVMGAGFANHLAGVAERNSGQIDSWPREALSYFRLILPGYLMLLLFYPIMGTIVDKALGVFGYVTGTAIIKPGQIIDNLQLMLDALWKGVAASGDPIALPIVAAIMSLVLAYIMAKLTGELIIVFARQYVVLSTLAMEIGWAGAPGTASFASDVYSATRAVFYHAGIVVAMIGLGLGFIPQWIALMASPPGGNLIRTIVTVVAEVVIFYTVASSVTEWADSLFSGRAALSGASKVESAAASTASSAVSAGGVAGRAAGALSRVFGRKAA